MSLYYILRYLKQLQCNIKILLIFIGDKVMDTDNADLGWLPIFKQEGNFKFQWEWSKN